LACSDRAWKSFGRHYLNRLYATGLISGPVGRAKSVAFTSEGQAWAEALLLTLLGESSGSATLGPAN